jgi:hypothetical protein
MEGLMRIHWEKGSRSLMFGIAIVVAIAGCKTTQAALDVSAPTAIPVGFVGKIDPDGSTTLFLQDLELIIESRNHRPHDTGLIWEGGFVYFLPIVFPVGRVSTTYEEDSGGPLTLSLTLAPEVAGFTFDPAAPSVDLGDGSAHSAAQFIGPAEASCAGAWAKAEAGREYPLLPGKKTCFVLLRYAKFSGCPFSVCALE